MPRYEIFNQLKNLLKLTKTEEGYSKFIQTGKLDIFDYNTGFIDLSVFVVTWGPDSKFYSVRLWFGTIDDCDFGGWRDVATKEQATNLVERIAHEVFEDMVSFPTKDELNTLLRPYKIYVCNE